MSYSSSFPLARLPHGGKLCMRVQTAPHQTSVCCMHEWYPLKFNRAVCARQATPQNTVVSSGKWIIFSRTIHQAYYIHMHVCPLVHTCTQTNTQMQPLTMLKGKECRKQWISLSFIHLNFSCFSCHPVYCYTQQEPCSKWIACSWHYHWQRQRNIFYDSYLMKVFQFLSHTNI